MVLYRLVNISLENLKFRWEHHRYDINTVKSNLRYFKNFNEKEIVYHLIVKIRESMVRKGILKPLIIKQEWYDETFDFGNNNSYVLVGNQRLSALRSMKGDQLERAVGNSVRKIPCIVTESDSSWGDDNPANQEFDEKPHPLVGINIGDLKYGNTERKDEVKNERFSGLIEELNKKEKDPYFEKTFRANKWFLEAEKQLLNPVPGSNQKMRDLIDVFESIKRDRQMWNPLVVCSDTDGMFYVTVGKQRLCSLRALNFRGLVPCRVFSTKRPNNILSMYPYKKVEYARG
jgi:hypothetical protein